MPPEGKKRPPRVPKTAEEVAELHLLKKIREFKKVERFKKTKFYKICNVFNLVSFFIYCELIICFIGPCQYDTHQARSVRVNYGDEKAPGQRIISSVKLLGEDKREYEFVVHEVVEVPQNGSPFYTGKDFLLQKNIKGGFSTSDNVYRLHRASPVLFLSFFVGIFSCIFFTYNLNQNPYSLRALTIINALTIWCFLVI